MLWLCKKSVKNYFKFYVFFTKIILVFETLTAIVLFMETTPSGVQKSSNVSPVALTAKSKTFVDSMSSSKGRFVSLTFKSNPKPSAQFKSVVLEKVTKGTFRTGVDFSQIKVVKDGIENGERGEVQGLLEGQSWAVFPFVIINKDGSQLLRLTIATGCKSEVTFKVNGLEVSREEFDSHLPPSARVKKDAPLVFNIKEANLLAIGEETL